MTGISHQANATDFAPVSLEQMVDASTMIIRGKVVRVWSEEDAHGLIWTRAEINVTESFKGRVPTTLIVDSLGGTVGEHHASVWGTSRFSANEDAFIFVEKLDNGRFSSFSMFNGKFTIRRAARDTELHLMKWHGNPAEPFDHRFLPYPAPEKRVYLNDFVERVEARVKAGWDGKPVPGVSMEALRKINVTTDGGLQ
jgi:hypothetical protein